MELKKINKDENWKQRVENIGFGFHTDENNQTYWVEDYYFSITAQEADNIFDATNKLWEMCLHAVDHVISQKKN